MERKEEEGVGRGEAAKTRAEERGGERSAGGHQRREGRGMVTPLPPCLKLTPPPLGCTSQVNALGPQAPPPPKTGAGTQQPNPGEREQTKGEREGGVEM